MPYTLFSCKNLFYKNVEPENGQNFKTMLTTYTRLRFNQNVKGNSKMAYCKAKFIDSSCGGMLRAGALVYGFLGDGAAKYEPARIVSLTRVEKLGKSSLVPRPTRAMRANRATSQRLGTERDSARPGKK